MEIEGMCWNYGNRRSMKSFVSIPSQTVMNKDGVFRKIFLTSKTIIKDFAWTMTSHNGHWDLVPAEDASTGHLPNACLFNLCLTQPLLVILLSKMAQNNLRHLSRFVFKNLGFALASLICTWLILPQCYMQIYLTFRDSVIYSDDCVRDFCSSGSLWGSEMSKISDTKLNPFFVHAQWRYSKAHVWCSMQLMAMWYSSEQCNSCWACFH